MNVELEILSKIPLLLHAYDRKRKGVAIDIGVGTGNFHCEAFRRAGYKSYAVEPLPSQRLKGICKKLRINLYESCICDFDGTVDIFSGRFNGNDCSDVSSIKRDWWGIDDKSRKISVRATTLTELLHRFEIKKITYMKIDTEGSEKDIIKQFVNLQKSELPEIVEFEYGGGASKKENKAGWSQEYFSQTLECINILKSLGYSYAVLFERELPGPVEFNLPGEACLEFKDEFVYGDMVFFKDKKIDMATLLNYQKPPTIGERTRTLVKRFLK